MFTMFFVKYRPWLHGRRGRGYPTHAAVKVASPCVCSEALNLLRSSIPESENPMTKSMTQVYKSGNVGETRTVSIPTVLG